MSAHEISAPISTEGTRSSGSPCAWLRCAMVQCTAAAIGTPSATKEPSHSRALTDAPNWPANIHAMPAPATTMAIQVRAGRRWPVTRTDIVTSTRATPVMVSATMKAVNIVAQHSPASQKARRRQGRRANTPGPCHSGRMTSSDTALKKLRQNVISKPCAACIWRVTTPAVDHSAVASTIVHTARACDQAGL